MPTLSSGRASAAVLALLALAAAPAAQAQQSPRWQVEASLDATGMESYTGVISDGIDGGLSKSQEEVIRYSVGAASLVRIAPRVSLRLGLSLSNKGFAERTESATETTVRQVDLLYLGAPITLGYNMASARQGLMPFAEMGVVPERLIRQDDSEFGLNLQRTGISYLVSLGAKYSLGDGRALTLGPEIRMSAAGYSRDTPNAVQFHPRSVGLKLGVQF